MKIANVILLTQFSFTVSCCEHGSSRKSRVMKVEHKCGSRNSIADDNTTKVNHEFLVTCNSNKLDGQVNTYL